MYFFIKQNSTLPTLRMELIEDGRHDFHKFHEAIQSATITFSMTNIDTNVQRLQKLTHISNCAKMMIVQNNMSYAMTGKHVIRKSAALMRGLSKLILTEVLKTIHIPTLTAY